MTRESSWLSHKVARDRPAQDCSCADKVPVCITDPKSSHCITVGSKRKIQSVAIHKECERHTGFPAGFRSTYTRQSLTLSWAGGGWYRKPTIITRKKRARRVGACSTSFPCIFDRVWECPLPARPTKVDILGPGGLLFKSEAKHSDENTSICPSFQNWLFVHVNKFQTKKIISNWLYSHYRQVSRASLR